MSRWSANRVLPGDVVIPSVDDLLYEIGLCLTSVRERPKRRAIDSPIVIAIVCSIFLVQRIASIFIDDHDYLVILGDFGHYLNFKILLNILFIIISLMALTSQ